MNVDLNNKQELEKELKILEDYCLENEVLDMAAVQLGIPKRLVYLKNINLDIVNRQQIYDATSEEKKYNEARILINPIITKKQGLTTYWEACASCLDNVGLVERPYKIYVEYYDINGIKHNEVFEGFESTVLSHEMNHLVGILHMDIAKKVLYLPLEERKKLRQSEEYIIINKDEDY